MTTEFFLSNKYSMFVILGGVLIPQIVSNAYYKSRYTPNMNFGITMALTHAFFALYIRGCLNNIFDLQPDGSWTIVFASFVALQILVLLLQRQLGSRFFIPRVCRFWNEYNYYRNFNEDMELGENQDGSHTC